ncbi:MAG: restriction endonuclease subunit S [Leptospirales bacterium]
MKGWKMVDVSQIVEENEASIQTGPFGTQLKASDYQSEGFPVINVRNIGLGQELNATLEHIGDHMAVKLKQHKLQFGDIVFSRKGAVERHLLITKKQNGYYQGSDCIRLRITSKDINKKFLSYFFLTEGHKQWMEAQGSFGATMGSLNQGIIKRIKFPLPPLPIQKKIAGVLSGYDELIENNNRRIAILEKMAEEIYREWFVRVRFPGHENTKIVKGVPEGWAVKRVKDIGTVVTGKTPSTAEPKYYTGKYSFIKTPDMHGNLFILQTEETLSEDGFRSQPTQILPEGSICVSCIGTGGIVTITTEKSQTNQQINSVISNKDYYLPWAFFTLCSLKETIKMFGSTGTTMTNLSKNKFANLKIFFPLNELLKQFHDVTIPLLEKHKTLLKANQNLKKTRDALLPRLISGKLDVENLDITLPPGMHS